MSWADELIKVQDEYDHLVHKINKCDTTLVMLQQLSDENTERIDRVNKALFHMAGPCPTRAVMITLLDTCKAMQNTIEPHLQEEKRRVVNSSPLPEETDSNAPIGFLITLLDKTPYYHRGEWFTVLTRKQPSAYYADFVAKLDAQQTAHCALVHVEQIFDEETFVKLEGALNRSLVDT